MPSNTHVAYMKCVHENCPDRNKDHRIASGSEEFCNTAVEKATDQGHEAYVRPLEEEDLK